MGLSIGAIIGIVIAVVGAIIIGIVLALALTMKSSNVSSSPTVTISQVLGWNQLALDSISAWTAPRPTVAARSLFMLHSIMYESYMSNYDLRKLTWAAYTAIKHYFPAYEASTQRFSMYRDSLLASLPPTDDPAVDEIVGTTLANTMINLRINDGSNEVNNYANPYPYNVVDDMNSWHPLPGQTYLTIHWGDVQMFGNMDVQNFMPPHGPPICGNNNDPYTDALGQTMISNDAFVQQMQQVMEINAHLTDEQKASTEYWANGPRSYTPPGHWNKIAQGLAKRSKLSFEQELIMFYLLNATLFNSSIACWQAKKTYSSCRPVTAIRSYYDGQTILGWDGPYQGTASMDGSNWKPYQLTTFVTPPFPEFTSGHSTFSASAAEILTYFLGTNRFYDGVTKIGEDLDGDGIEDYLGQNIVTQFTFENNNPRRAIYQRWNTLQDAAADAGMSRIYGGIHFQDGNLFGQDAGRRVAQAVWQYYQANKPT